MDLNYSLRISQHYGINYMTTIQQAKAFLEYCEKYPDLRFWQALSSFTGNNIFTSNLSPGELPPGVIDTYYFKN